MNSTSKPGVSFLAHEIENLSKAFEHTTAPLEEDFEGKSQTK